MRHPAVLFIYRDPDPLARTWQRPLHRWGSHPLKGPTSERESRLALSQCASHVSRVRGNSPLCRHAIRPKNCRSVSVHSRKPLDRTPGKHWLTLPPHSLAEYGVCPALAVFIELPLSYLLC